MSTYEVDYNFTRLEVELRVTLGFLYVFFALSIGSRYTREQKKNRVYYQLETAVLLPTLW